VPEKLKFILKVPVIIIILFPSFTLKKPFAVSSPLPQSVNDSLVIVSGYIQDSLTGLGIGNVMIKYKELPYGNFVGIIKSRESDGYYSYRTFGHEKYIIVISSDQYLKKIDTLYPFSAQGNQINRNYLLSKKPSEALMTLDNLIFDLGKAEIKPESYDELDDLVDLMKANPDMIIQLEGHTDFRGGRSKNYKLSEERVKQVKNYLIHGGIMPDRILTKAFGGSNPLSWENTEEASRLNRRVEVRIISR
jgi:outer membrane protein OmpA-like peptidoglycan-associated protein